MKAIMLTIGLIAFAALQPTKQKPVEVDQDYRVHEISKSVDCDCVNCKCDPCVCSLKKQVTLVDPQEDLKNANVNLVQEMNTLKFNLTNALAQNEEHIQKISELQNEITRMKTLVSSQGVAKQPQVVQYVPQQSYVQYSNGSCSDGSCGGGGSRFRLFGRRR